MGTSRLTLVYEALQERRLPTEGVRRLLEHPRNNGLLQMEGSCFYYAPPRGAQGAAAGQGWIPLKGLTSLLRDFYWPNHRPWGTKRKRQDSAPPSAASALVKRRTAPTGQWAAPIMGATGNVRGSIVHRQLAEFVNLGRDQFLAQNRQVHPLVQIALRTLERASLYPLLAEYRVAQVDVRLGSAVDLLCVNMRTGAPTWIEVKTSARRSLFEGAGPDDYAGLLATINARQEEGKRPVLAYSDCARARIQLGVSLLMGIEGTGFTGAYDAFVLLLADDQIEGRLYEVNKAFLKQYAEPLYKDIQQRLPEWRKTRGKMRGRDVQ
jgi:hypothetical protein